MKIDIPANVQTIITELEKENFQAYVYGSCLRDKLLGRPTLTWDICTSALPSDIVHLFDEKDGYNTIPELRDYASVTVIYHGDSYHLSAFRTGEKHRFSDSIEEALRYNDFTMNSIAFSAEKGFIDPYNGITDIHKRRLKCVGNPVDKLKEDPVRILRAVRFEAELGFVIEETLLAGIASLGHTLDAANPEKLCNELTQLLLIEKPSHQIKRLLELGLLKHLIPELIPAVGFDTHSSYHDKDVFEHSLVVMDNTKANLSLRLAALLHDIDKPHCLTIDENGEGHCYGHANSGSQMAADIMNRLNFDRKTIKAVCALIKEHMNNYDNMSELSIKRLVRRVGFDNIDNLFELQLADIKGSKLSERSVEPISSIRNKCWEVLSRREPLNAHDVDISGYDLMAMGYAPGQEIGLALEYLLDKVVDNPALNRKEILSALLKEKE